MGVENRMIRLDNVTKTFGDTVAVDNLSLEVNKGECFVFLGPNAAGKTTTIKLIAGLLRPTAGKVYVAGFDMEKDSLNAKQHLSYMPDVPYLYDKLTGYEFLEFVARLFDVPQNEMRADIKKYVEMFDIERYQHKLIEDYSHGLKQRFTLCAALIHNPKIIIVDEPMVALDPIGIRLVKDIVREKVRNGVTVFMSTHTLSIADELATCIGIIHKGKLRAMGTKSQLQAIAKKADIEEIFLQLTNDEK
jgi:ABC-2 type transport system ATP-binding protein